MLFLTLKFSLALITRVCSSQSWWFLFFHSVSYLGLLGFVFPFAEQSDSSCVSCLKTDARGLSLKNLWPEVRMFCKVKSTNGLFLSDAVGVYHSNIVKIIKY